MFIEKKRIVLEKESGAQISFGTVEIKGMALAAVLGVVLSILFYIFNKFGWMNYEYKVGENE